MKNSQTPDLTIEQQIELVQQNLKDLKAQKKTLNQKEKAPKKGDLVEFTNKAGEVIKGLGRLYYCVSIDNKLHYKQVDSVTVLQKND